MDIPRGAWVVRALAALVHRGERGSAESATTRHEDVGEQAANDVKILEGPGSGLTSAEAGIVEQLDAAIGWLRGEADAG
jgi:hypothetical protein